MALSNLTVQKCFNSLAAKKINLLQGQGGKGTVGPCSSGLGWESARAVCLLGSEEPGEIAGLRRGEKSFLQHLREERFH